MTSASRPGEPADRAARWQLAFAAAAVLLAAADTYVVVVALPSIMGGVGLGLDHLQRATPIVSGFLLGYVAVLPLLGRLSDLVGRTPVFAGCLVAFGAGSLLTATAHALSVLVAGRALQGLGGGGLVPVTLALVAQRWDAEDRGLPLGVVGAVQELGSVIGPLYGAAVVSVATWRAIFWINLPLAATLGAAFVLAGRGDARRGEASRGEASRVAPAGPRAAAPRRLDVVGVALGSVGAAGVGLGLWAPASLVNSVTWGGWWTPRVAGAAWVGLTSPVALLGFAALAAAAVWRIARMRVGSGGDPAPGPRLREVLAGADLPGAALLAGVLACVVVIFSTADGSRHVVAASTPALAPVAVALLAGFVLRQRRAARPLIDPALLASRAARAAAAVNLTIGAGLIAALVDVPFFARATRYPSSQVGAALVLVRFLVAVPAGALVGGVVIRRRSLGPAVAAFGAAVAAGAFVAMASWGPGALSTPWRVAGASLGFGASDVALVACGFGFGLVIAPVNAAVLASVPDRLHGLGSALVVVARTIGMLAGLSALTALGVHRFYRAQARIGSPLVLCPSHPGSCPAYDKASTAALLSELHTIFAGAAVCTAVAAVVALLWLRAPARQPASLTSA